MAAADAIAKALGGRKAGSGWIARCPAHDDREPSLSIRDADGKVLVRCHAGCAQRDLIVVLRERGLWDGKSRSPLRRWRLCSTIQQKRVPPEPSDAGRTGYALGIWQSAIQASSTLVETYLASRGLKLSPPPSLRFHRGLQHPSGGVWPCMLALVTRGADNAPLAIHRTFLARDGRGKASVDPVKMMLGPCRGGAVRLSQPSDMLMVGEGIETCLAAMQATDHPAWAALSTSGLRALDMPDYVRDVIVLADGDDPGECRSPRLRTALATEGPARTHRPTTTRTGFQ